MWLNYCVIIGSKGYVMNILELPIDGVIDFDNGRKINVRLRKGENDKLILESLDKDEDWQFGYYTLKGIFKTYINNYNITFLDCYKTDGRKNFEIEYSGYILYSNFEEKDDLTFIDIDTPRDEIFFRVQNLDKWLYPSLEMGKEQIWSYANTNNEQVNSRKDAEFLRVKLKNKTQSCKFKYFDEDFELTIYDKFEGLALDYPKFEFYPDCYIGIKGTNKHDVIFFNDLIEKIRKLLSLFYNQVAVIKSIYEFKKFKYHIDYNFLYKETKEDDFFLNDFNINFGFVSSIFGDVLQKWFNIFDEYELIINSVCNYEEPKALSDSISKKAQLLETYGNITNKGANSREDIKTAISELKLENLKRIFHINKEEQDYITWHFDLRKLGSDIEGQILNLSDQIMNLRNHSVHPYKLGKQKKPKDSNISNIFIYNYDKLNLRAIKTLSNCLSTVLIILLLQKLDIDKYYKQY